MAVAQRSFDIDNHQRADLPSWVSREAALLDQPVIDDESDFAPSEPVRLAKPSTTKDTGLHSESGTKNWLARWAMVLTGGLTIAFFISVLAFKAFWIPSNSMVPNLEPGDRVLVNKLVGLWSEPERGEMVVFQRENDDLVKRVVGIPGEFIALHEGGVWINGQKIDEPYLEPGTTTAPISGNVTFQLGASEYLLLGDNRSNSLDSRAFGPVHAEDISGPVLVKFWPFGALQRY